ncbi:SDR family NAD(P)-dependent oxidoreductase [Actinocrispum wychmicini]|uniref:Short-subunit dehydrogenase n=1 Tax=Actinocrispum wychmicini TaxID=1213861 RepID=A0A4R2JZG9_9PSEU|nr:SDR family oxidoreductase [Actinocrispum wychmicini]TCO62699.1 short-subunit dehydrogenase [Actinocrispum wychmicini]
MLLKDKNAVIYGGAGAIGSSAARAFAAEGAHVTVVGRTQERLEPLAKEIGGAWAVVDALDADAVNAHLADLVADRGSVDISLNLVSRGDVQGIPLLQMSTSDFIAPVTAGLTSNFITAQAAGRHMVEQGSGVILALDSGSAQGSPMMGGTGPADAAIDTFVRNLATEIGPQGVRVLGVWTAGVPDTFAPEFAGTNPTRDATGMGPEDLERIISQLTMLRRAPRLADVVSTLTFLASDRAGSITGTFVNVTSGIFAS